jgi:hypothetical protein
MSNQIYPDEVRWLKYNVVKTPEFSTTVQTAVSAAEVRITNWQNPIWHWELTYEVIRDQAGQISPGLAQTDLRTLMGFYMARQGKFDSFLYSDPNDNTVTPDAQTLPVVVSGGFSYTPIQRLMGDADGFYEDITDLDGPLSLYDNGVLMNNPTDYTVLGPGVALDGYAFQGLVAKWAAAPTGPITAAFSFFFRARFDVDRIAFEEFVDSLWTLGGSEASVSESLKLISARVPLL